MTTSKRIPPYGRPLYFLIQKRQRPRNSVYLYVGAKAWTKGKISAELRPARTLVLPGYIDPSTYQWPVHDCDILIIDTGFCDQTYIEDLVRELFQAKAQIVRFVSPDYLLTVYQKDL